MTSIPLTLSERISEKSASLHYNKNVVAFPYFWQFPAATEKAAYEAVLALQQDLDFDYFGFPWATLIDGLRDDAPKTWDILMALRQACAGVETTRRRVTVAQHIHAIKFIDLFKACGITDIFWSHAVHAQTEVQGIRLHPFPLFPAQTPNGLAADNLSRPRKHLTNFIGAFNPSIYLSDVRQHIFNDEGRWPDVLIIKRDSWHFDRVVYDEQIKGLSASAQQKKVEGARTKEYLDAIKESRFTLCPTGSGPNSIRIFEALALGSVPIVLSRDLKLAGTSSDWTKSAIIEDDSAAGYQRALKAARNVSDEAWISMVQNGQKLFNSISPQAFGRLIVTTANIES